MAVGISAVASYVPPRVVTNEELAATIDTSDEWILTHTGIRERHIAGDGVFASDLAVEAGRLALASRELSPDQVDLVLVATSSPDYNPFPATASLVQESLGCSNAGAFDLQAGCSGFVYGLESARGMVTAGSMERVLLVGSEVLSRITNWSDRNTCVLFGDGAGAAIIERGDTSGAVTVHTVEDGWLRSQGKDATALIRAAGGTRVPFDSEGVGAAEFSVAMNGKKVYLFAVDALVKTVHALCERNGLEADRVDWIVPHQANARIIEAAGKRLGLPIERFYMCLDRYANTSAASIPIALAEMEQAGRLFSGQRIITVGFGAGLTYGGNLITW